MRRTALVAWLVPALLAMPSSASAPLSDNNANCDMLVPATQTANPALVTRTSPRIALDVLVLLEPRHLDKVKADLAVASRAYAPWGIDLRPRWRSIGRVPDLDGDAVAYLSWLKKQVPGGVRPRGVDVVYLATDRVIHSAGRADCIGGVAYPEHAFAVGQLTFNGLIGVNVVGSPVPVPSPPVTDSGAKLIAHEIGHLMGAHHHYGNCAGLTTTDPAHPCDVMLSLAKQQIGLHFGALNGAVVRDHGERFATP